MSMTPVVARISKWFDDWFLWLLVGAYMVAGFFPGAGLALQHLKSGPIHLFGQSTTISSGMVMLSFLLLNAGMGVDLSHLGRLRKRVGFVILGVAANVGVPLVCVLLLSPLQFCWHNPDEMQNILVGLALVVSMPIAGSSTAWSQKARGNLALSIGLVLVSSLCSPLTTPLALNAISLVTTGDYSEDLQEIASGTTGLFLALCVIAPSVIGIGVRAALGSERVAAIRPLLRLSNALVLLVLIYANTSVSLPEAVHNFDADFMALTFALVATLCVISFASGALVAWLARSDRGERAAFVFGLGMNNNGSGLVLASLTLADHPRVMLPLILYNLVQHFGAGLSDRLMFSGADAGAEVAAGKQARSTLSLNSSPAPKGAVRT
jgi:BASS family bile acid:Na+ symporter